MTVPERHVFHAADAGAARNLQRRSFAFSLGSDSITESSGFALNETPATFLEVVRHFCREAMPAEWRLIGWVPSEHLLKAEGAMVDVLVGGQGRFDEQARHHFTVMATGPSGFVLSLLASLRQKYGDTRLATISWWFQTAGGANYRTLPMEPPLPVFDEFYPWLADGVDEYLERFIDDPASVLFMMGPPGTGKTSLLRHMIYSHRLAATLTYDETLLERDELFINFICQEEAGALIIEDADLLVGSREMEGNKLISRRNYALYKVRGFPILRVENGWTSAMLTLNQVSAYSEEQAREAIERIIWPNGPICPHCGSVENLTRMQGNAHRAGLFQCNNCHEQFTVTINTIFEDSHIPLRKWLMAFALLCSAKKGISALQLQRELELGSYRTAWHMAHRIRHAMSREPLAGLLAGTVEVDETYVGARRPRKEAGAPKPKSGRGTKKIPVVALVERGGRVRARKIDRVDGATLKGAIRENVDRKARIMTDEWAAYRGIGQEYAGGHEVVTHSAGEYVRGDAHTQTVESYFALLKRGVMGSFHHVSKQHLDLYCDEFSFRWDHRYTSDSERTEVAIQQTKGKRLSYKRPIS